MYFSFLSLALITQLFSSDISIYFPFTTICTMLIVTVVPRNICPKPHLGKEKIYNPGVCSVLPTK